MLLPTTSTYALWVQLVGHQFLRVLKVLNHQRKDLAEQVLELKKINTFGIPPKSAEKGGFVGLVVEVTKEERGCGRIGLVRGGGADT